MSTCQYTYLNIRSCIEIIWANFRDRVQSDVNGSGSRHVAVLWNLCEALIFELQDAGHNAIWQQEEKDWLHLGTLGSISL